MKIAIVGAGAMGSVYAGLLGSGDNEVWAVDRWAEHIDAIRKQGLRVQGASGDRVVRIHATTDAAEPGEAEMVVIATKAMDVAAAAEEAHPLVGENTLVLSIQNGLGAPDIAARVLGEERVAKVVLKSATGTREVVRHAVEKDFWARPDSPDTKDETVSNWMTKVERLKVTTYVEPLDPAR